MIIIIAQKKNVTREIRTKKMKRQDNIRKNHEYLRNTLRQTRKHYKSTYTRDTIRKRMKITQQHIRGKWKTKKKMIIKLFISIEHMTPMVIDFERNPLLGVGPQRPSHHLCHRRTSNDDRFGMNRPRIFIVSADDADWTGIGIAAQNTMIGEGVRDDTD